MRTLDNLKLAYTRAQDRLATANTQARLAQEEVTNANRAAGKAKDELEIEQKREAWRRLNRARDRAKRLAAKHDVTIEKENFPEGPLYWVHPPEGRYGDNGEGDPLDGCHSCSGWQEVLQAVETYADAFKE